MNTILRTILLLVFVSFIGCNSKSGTKKNNSKGFNLVESKQSGISFSNTITTSDTFNYNTYPYIYMGGGVALGDINNDNLTDVFLTGNMVPNKLYLNKGNMQFEDIGAEVSIEGDSRWYTGVTMVDINTDGWLDIYVCVSGLGNKTQNQLFVNNGPSAESGQVSFTEMAANYGIADKSNSIQSTFFDADNDGDLDLYVCNYPTIPLTMPNLFYFDKMQLRTPSESGHLYRNEGNGKFTDITEESGVLNFGLSLGVVASDFNNDGWKDLYVSNDFYVPDYFYINNGDGTFSEQIKETTRQTSMFGMGVDAADFNNDGLIDLFQVDMTPEDHYRAKTNMASMNTQSFNSAVSLGFHYQYMQNSLQINNGNSPEGLPIFSNIARLTGMATTDWSWAPLFADFDNDGLKDIVITNGMRLDVNNNDLLNREKNTTLIREKIDMNKAPSTPIGNYMFRNEGNYKFEDVSAKWNANVEGFSNGIAYGDLDNDGDLDLVINNIDQEASLLQNNTQGSNYIRFKLKGSEKNPIGIGAKVKIISGKLTQEVEQSLTRGFQSSIEPILHFGLEKNKKVEVLEVLWADGKVEHIKNIPGNQTLELDYSNAQNVETSQKSKELPFKDITMKTGIDFIHKEDLYDDFRVEPLLPHRNSQLGPALAIGDVDKNGLDDIFVGNATNKKASLFLQSSNGTFKEMKGPWDLDRKQEDTGAVFFDADADGDLDLYVTSGGNNFGVNTVFYQDRLYINTDEGFVKLEGTLPKIESSGLKVVPADYDNDGDLDLFVGGRIIPGYYGQPPKSYLLENNGATEEELQFTDVTSKIAPDLQNLGMVTDAVWQDFDGDGNMDIILAGEWLPLSFFKNDGSSFKNITEELGMGDTVGWWYSLATQDLDNDGDMDIVAGNLGLNSKNKSTAQSPFEIYINDFDENNRQDIVLSVTKKGTKLPIRGRECSSQQIPAIKRKFETYKQFASASLEEIYGEQMLESSIHYQIDTFAHHWFENMGNGNYKRHQLPIETQFSSINDIVFFDYDQDAFPDILLAGNLYDTEVETPRSDAGVGLVLQNSGKKSFTPIPMHKTGLLIDREVKNLSLVGMEDGLSFVFGINNEELKIIAFDRTQKNMKQSK
nr:VCBS repeat-containing protein [uncultured Allomuricauda sp.]